MPVPAPPGNTVYGIEQAIRDAITKLDAIDDIVPGLERITLAVADDAAIAVVPGTDLAASETVTTLAGAVASFFTIPEILLVVVCVIISRMTEGVLINVVLSLLPFGFGKNQVRGALTAYFGFINRIEDAAIHFATAQARLLLHNFIVMVGFAVGQLGVELPAKTGPPRTTPGQVATEAQIQTLQRELNQLRNELSTVRYTVGAGTVTVGVPQTVWDQLHSMQAELHNQAQSIRQIQVQLEGLVNSGAETAQQVQELTGALHAVRAVSTTWSEVEQQLVQLQHRVTGLTTSTQRDIHHLTATQTMLQPLTLLLGAGIPGLKVLRQLEDTPCMCPQIPDIPGIVAEGLAVLEFLENG